MKIKHITVSKGEKQKILVMFILILVIWGCWYHLNDELDNEEESTTEPHLNLKTGEQVNITTDNSDEIEYQRDTLIVGTFSLTYFTALFGLYLLQYEHIGRVLSIFIPLFIFIRFILSITDHYENIVDYVSVNDGLLFLTFMVSGLSVIFILMGISILSALNKLEEFDKEILEKIIER